MCPGQIFERGSVRAQNRPLPGALITALRGSDKVVVSTDEDGNYALELGEGEWSLTVEMFGFVPAVRTLRPAPGAPPVHWTLELVKAAVAAGEASAPEPVLPEVHEAPGAPEPVETAANESFLLSGSLSQGLPPAMAEAPPEAPGRATDPNAPPPGVFGGNEAGETPGGGVGRRGGSRGPGGRKFSREAVEKIKKARAARGNVVLGNRQRKPSRGAIRAQLSYTTRSSAWNARPFSITGLDYERPDQASNRLSLTAGGAVPQFGAGTAFTVSYDLRLDRRAFNGVATVPTLLERGGDFSRSETRAPVTIYDPSNRLPFPGNRIPASRVDAASAGLAQLIPLPNFGARVQNYQFITGVPSNGQSLSARLNRPVTRKDRLSVNQTWQTRDAQSAQLFGFLDESDGSGWSTELTWTRNLNAKTIQTIRAKAARNTTDLVPFFAGRRNVAAELGIRGPSDDPANWGPPNLNFTNFGALRDGFPSARREFQMSASAAWSFVRGRHNFSTGGDFLRTRMNTRTDSNGRGTFTFSGLATSFVDAQGTPAAASGFDYADFLLGLPQSSSIRFGTPANYFRALNFNGFAQDDWKARRNLTLTLGLRYESYGPFLERYNRLANLDIAPGFSAVAVVQPGQAGPYGGEFPRSLIDRDRNNFSPRTGLAWKVSSKHSLTVRAAYGIYYNGVVYQNFAQRLASQPPFANTSAIQTSPARVLTIRDGFSATPSQRITNTFAVDRSYLVGYAQNWNLGLSKEFKRAYVLEAGILGTKGTRLDMQRLPNRAAPGSQLNAEQRRAIGNAVGFTLDSSEANSIYHAAQVRLTRRFTRSVSFTNTYMFGKSIDNASSLGGGGGTVAQDDTNLRAERGPSSFNIRHLLTSTFVLASPIRDRSRSLWANLLRGWMTTGSITLRSGTPLTARVLGNRSDSGGTGAIGAGRADATGLAIDDGAGFFNPGAFTLPPSGRFGNAGRNTITAPTLFALNGSFGRGFRVGGDSRRRLEFRLEGSNLTNRVTISSLGTVVNASNYGLPLGAAPMRMMQANVRLRF